MLTIEETQLKLKDLKQAVDIEKQRRYVDVQGRKKNFSSFVLETLRHFKTSQLNENTALENLLTKFSHYRFMDMSARMTALENLESFLQEFNSKQTAPKTTTKSSPVSYADKRSLHEIEVQYVKGIGPRFALTLAQVGILTVENLLYYFPRRYLDYNNRTRISELTEGQDVTVMGEIRSVSAYQPPNRNMTIVSLTVFDGTGTVSVNWFYGKSSRAQLENYKSRYTKGSEVMLSGRVKWDRFKKTFAIDRPELQVLSYGQDVDSPPDPSAATLSIHAGRIVPVYPLCEGLNLKSLRRAIHQALQDYLPRVVDPLPSDIQHQNQLTDLTDALRQIHFPSDTDSAERARKRLVFDELFYMQLRLALLRQQYKQSAKAYAFQKQPGSYIDRFVSQLPFQLTNAQQRVFQEILADLSSEQPMYRLLQGDVGSGKTVIAALSLLVAVENGYQGALMAPTEILAEQHYRRFLEWLTPLGLKVGLFVGKSGAKERRELRQGLLNGQIHIAIGTHALIQDDVEFAKLGVVVVDEQHRFGVRQRTLLKSKADHPEMLTMTATPIPRTLAMTAHGDLDVSVIDELPPGRSPIKTTLLTNTQRKQTYQLVKQEVAMGRQAYIVFPLIEESETLAAKAATTEAQRLQAEIFPHLKIGLLHGKLKPEEKETVMQQFIEKKLDILVATTVIEVGVDVPNATVMIIENADRFGLAQLHQLRGRVGRGEHQSYCALISDSRGEDTMQRLGIMTQTEDGFLIAEKDLEIRGPGEFLGTRQSGLPDMALADLIQDKAILEAARTWAFKIADTPGYLQQHPELEAMIYQKTDSAFSVLGSG